MKLKLQKRENSKGIRIPNNILISLNLKTNVPKEKISLEERFLKYKGENLAKDFTWDNHKGKEIW